MSSREPHSLLGCDSPTRHSHHHRSCRLLLVCDGGVSMKERPILFSAPMVQAILDDRKGETRRIVRYPEHIKKKHSILNDDTFGEKYVLGRTQKWIEEGGLWHPCAYYVECSGYQPESVGLPCPYGVPGDRLWVKEDWRTWESCDDFNATEMAERCWDAGYQRPWAFIAYDAGGCINSNTGLDNTTGRLRRARFMPRWASRILLEVTEVRVERVQDITEAGAIAEGIDPLFTHKQIHEPRYYPEFDLKPMPWRNYLWHGNFNNGEGNRKSDAWHHQYSSYEKARDSYSSLWESINGPGSWDANPWVWVIKFRRIQ